MEKVAFVAYPIKNVAEDLGRSAFWVHENLEGLFRNFEDFRRFATYTDETYVAEIDGSYIKLTCSNALGDANYIQMEDQIIKVSGSFAKVKFTLEHPSGNESIILLPGGDDWYSELGYYVSWFEDNLNDNQYFMVRSYLPTTKITAYSFEFIGGDAEVQEYANSTVRRRSFWYWILPESVPRLTRISNIKVENTIPEKFNFEQPIKDFLSSLNRVILKLKAYAQNIGITKDPDNFPISRFRSLANNIGLDVNNQSTMGDTEKRDQIRYATEWYKIKGTENSVGMYLFSAGMNYAVEPLWTKDYVTGDFYISQLSSEYYPSPHFNMIIKPKTCSITEALLKSAIDKILNVIPVHTVPHLYFTLKGEGFDDGSSNTLDGVTVAVSDQVQLWTINDTWNLDGSVHYTYEIVDLLELVQCRIGRTDRVANPVLSTWLDVPDTLFTSGDNVNPFYLERDRMTATYNPETDTIRYIVDMFFNELYSEGGGEFLNTVGFFTENGDPIFFAQFPDIQMMVVDGLSFTLDVTIHLGQRIKRIAKCTDNFLPQTYEACTAIVGKRFGINSINGEFLLNNEDVENQNPWFYQNWVSNDFSSLLAITTARVGFYYSTPKPDINDIPGVLGTVDSSLISSEYDGSAIIYKCKFHIPELYDSVINEVAWYNADGYMMAWVTFPPIRINEMSYGKVVELQITPTNSSVYEGSTNID